jgi:hypothetical protein
LSTNSTHQGKWPFGETLFHWLKAKKGKVAQVQWVVTKSVMAAKKQTNFTMHKEMHDSACYIWNSTVFVLEMYSNTPWGFLFYIFSPLSAQTALLFRIEEISLVDRAGKLHYRATNSTIVREYPRSCKSVRIKGACIV